MLQLELERTIDELANADPRKAPKGASPTAYLEIRRAALNGLIQKRAEYRQAATALQNETTDANSKGPSHCPFVEATSMQYET